MSERDKDFGLTQLLRFCRANDERGECFADWPNDILLHWLRWHWEAGNLYCFADGDELVTVAVGWRLCEGDLDDHITKYWGSAGGGFDSFYVSDVISKSKRGVASAIKELAERVPEWRGLKLFARRHGKVKQLNHKFFDRLCNLKEQ